MLVCYAFCCVVIVQEVVRRFGLNFSSAWGEEAARYAFIYLGWIGAAYAVRERAHIRFDFVLQRLSPRPKAAGFPLASAILSATTSTYSPSRPAHRVDQLTE